MNEQLKEFQLEQWSAICCLRKAGHPLQAAMLIYASIDQLAWLAIESSHHNHSHFKSWINQYFPKGSIEKLGVTIDELWEARNALLHMATTESRKVREQNGKKPESNIRKLCYYIAGQSDLSLKSTTNDTYFVNLSDLSDIFAAAALNFLTDINKTKNPRLEKKLAQILVSQPLS